MTKNDNAILVDGLMKLVEGAGTLLSFLTQQTAAPEDKHQDIPAAPPAKEYTYEEARAVLAEKSRTGFRAEVKAILTNHGVTQLSDVKNPKELAAIVAEVEEIKVG